MAGEHLRLISQDERRTVTLRLFVKPVTPQWLKLFDLTVMPSSPMSTWVSSTKQLTQESCSIPLTPPISRAPSTVSLWIVTLEEYVGWIVQHMAF